MKKAFVILLAVTICLLYSGPYLYAEYYKDGGEHWLSSGVENTIVVANSSDGNKTILHFMNGASIASNPGNLYVYGQSEVYMTGGTVPWSLIAMNSSYAEVSGGSITHLVAEDESDIVMFGGRSTTLSANENGFVSLYGGRVSSAYSWDDAQFDIFGGSVNRLILRGDSTMVIHGTDFAIDGIAVDYGAIDFSSQEMSGMLTCNLLNGDYLNASFIVYDNPQLILIPEPATLLLLGLGGFLIRKR